MSSIVCEGTLATSARIAASDRRKLGGDHLSKRSESSRTAVSPRDFTSAMIASTAARVFASDSSCWPASAAVLIWRGMQLLLFNDLVGLRQQDLRHSQPKRLRGFQIDDQLELHRLQDGQLGWNGTPQNATGVVANL